MKKLVIAAVAAALLPMSASLQAKTVCLSLFGGGAQMKISMKPIHKPGTFSAVTGFYQQNGGSSSGPLEGSAMVMADGSVTLGFNLHTMLAPQINTEILYTAVGLDTSLQGIYQFDSTGDGVADSIAAASAFSCKDFVLLPSSP